MDGELWMVWNGGVEEKKEGPVRLADGRAMIARFENSSFCYFERKNKIELFLRNKLKLYIEVS